MTWETDIELCVLVVKLLRHRMNILYTLDGLPYFRHTTHTTREFLLPSYTQ